MPENAAEKLALAAKPTPSTFQRCFAPRGVVVDPFFITPSAKFWGYATAGPFIGKAGISYHSHRKIRIMSQRGFDFAQLRTFVAVAESGSGSAGAERVFLSQSSVSEQLKKLEERAGQPLFIRGRQGVSPTPAG